VHRREADVMHRVRFALRGQTQDGKVVRMRGTALVKVAGKELVDAVDEAARKGPWFYEDGSWVPDETHIIVVDAEQIA
jgi:hypothetical protein